jgi:S-phase kinase-associated protein 1
MTKAKNLIRIISKEGEDFEASFEITRLSEWMKEKYEELDNSGRQDEEDQALPLPHIKSSILSKVIEFCEHHLIEPMDEIEKVSLYVRNVSLI